jgi:superfamily II DNA or RNA helicase
MASIDARTLTGEEKSLIHRELSVYVDTEYCKKRYLAYDLYNGVYRLPIHWANLNIPHKLEINFSTNRINLPNTSIVLRTEQEKCVEACLVEFEKGFGGGIINLSTGAGKTIISIYLMSMMKYKTLIVVNKVELLNQWATVLKQYFPDTRIGIIQGDKFESDCDICIGMLQTISMRKDYTADMFKDFTLVFIDEVHNTPSQVFSKALHKIRSKYTFGLSATVERKDNLECIFIWNIGPIIYSDKKNSAKQKTIFKKINFKGKSSKEIQLYNGKLNLSLMLSNLANDDERTFLICKELSGLSDDRRVLVLSDRISQLKKINSILGNETSGLFIGKCSMEEREESKKKKYLLATFMMASEGFNHPELNTLVFATPRSNVSQAIGRIYRKKHDIQPMIIDVVDSVGVFFCQYNKRKNIYKSEISNSPDTLEEQMEAVCLFD